MCDSCEWEDFASLIKEILTSMGDLPDDAYEFADGAGATLEGILEWVETNRHITEAQKTAVLNTERAVNNWLGKFRM